MDQETLNTLMSMVILPLLLALSGFAVEKKDAGNHGKH